MPIVCQPSFARVGVPIEIVDTHYWIDDAGADTTVDLATSAQGDLMIVVVQTVANGGADTVTPGGWTRINHTVTQDATASTAFVIFYKFMGAVPDTTLTIDIDDALKGWFSIALRNVDTGTPFGTIVAEHNGGATGTEYIPDFTTTVQNALVLAFANHEDDGLSAADPPAGWTQMAFDTTPGGHTYHSAYKFFLPPTSYTAAEEWALTLPSTDNIGMLVIPVYPADP